MTLQTIHAAKAAGSFSEELSKWKKWLQTIETVLGVWLEVQTNWAEMEEVRLDFQKISRSARFLLQ